MKAYADFNDFEIVNEYEDAGKSIEGRMQFNQMMEDVKSGKGNISYVLAFKLSRFGRNAADVLSTLQVMQDFGVNIICVEDGIDSSKDAGKLMNSVLSVVAEIERENIRIQTFRAESKKQEKENGMVDLHPMDTSSLMAHWRSAKKRLQSEQSMTSMLIRILVQMEFQNIWKIMVFARYSAKMGRIPFLMHT